MSASDTELNQRMMAIHGIEVGQVRRHGERGSILVVKAAEHFPRNGKGLVRCQVRWSDRDPWESTHYWPETLVRHPVIGVAA